MTNSSSEVDWFGDETGHAPAYEESWRLDDLDDLDDTDLLDEDDDEDADRHL
jgi:hypothetical protein